MIEYKKGKERINRYQQFLFSPKKNKKTNMIITFLGKNNKSYKEEKIKAAEWNCPNCLVRAKIHSKYKRKLIEESEIKEITIYRVKCRKCKKTHSIIPDFICPNKMYSAKVIEESIKEIENKTKITETSIQAEESTIMRWMKSYKIKIKKILIKLEEILIKEYNELISLIHSDKKGLKRLKEILKKFPNIESSSLIGLTNRLLSINQSKTEKNKQIFI